MRYVVPLAIIMTLILVMAFYDTVAELVWFIGYIVVFSLAGGALITLAFGALSAHERLRKMGLERKRQKYEIIKDGFGMVHLLNLETDIIENLSAYPGTHHNGRWEEPHPAAAAAWFALVGKTRSESPVNLLPATTPQSANIDLLPIMDRAKRVLIHGASEGGKTTLLQHIASRSEGVIIVDPHYEPGKWPRGKVIGKGRNFDEVVAFLNWLDTELDRRSKRMEVGDTNFKPITVIIDELSTIKLHCGNEAIKPLAMMIMESNKFGFRLFIGGHSKLVDLLGLKGMGDIREGLFFVHLYYNQTRNERRSTIDLGDGQGEQPCTFPPFARNSEAVIPDLVIQPPSEESDILRHAGNGAAYHVISQAVWGEGKIGSYYNRKIDAVLQKYGVEVKK